MHHSVTKMIFGIVVSGSLMIGALQAQQAVDPIQALDRDGDNKVSAAEHAAGAQNMFERFDTDQDGILTLDELAPPQAGTESENARQMAASVLKVMDADGDGVLSNSEQKAALRKQFLAIDEDSDGYLMREDF